MKSAQVNRVYRNERQRQRWQAEEAVISRRGRGFESKPPRTAIDEVVGARTGVTLLLKLRLERSQLLLLGLELGVVAAQPREEPAQAVVVAYECDDDA